MPYSQNPTIIFFLNFIVLATFLMCAMQLEIAAKRGLA